jgi:hypothetical protein
MPTLTNMYRSGTPIVSFGHKRKYRDGEYGETNAFYVIQPTICGKPSGFIKIGRTTDLRRRFAGYARVYDAKFDILHLRTFRQARLDTVFEEETGRRVSNFATSFETRVKQALKQMGVRPFRTDSDEIYPASAYDSIKKAVTSAVAKATGNDAKVVSVRRSKRDAK